ncbi:MAG: HAMP domain-containing histidine kinase [Clostridia bacterium]|nr:HAMP domain-containing histidine kinase [Clostridia bacterium]
MLKKLRVKFVCINMLIVTAMLCAMFAMLFSFTKSNLEAESIQMMEDIANDPFHLGRPDERPNGVRLPYFTLQIGLRGTLIATGGGYYDLSDEAFLQKVMVAALEQQQQTGVLEEYSLRYYRAMTPTSHLLVFADTTSEQATLVSMMQTFAVIGVLSFLVFLAVSLLLARWAVKPVDRAWTQQKQFVADASHELKTPLTVIMTNAELLQTPELEEADRSQLSGNILAMSHQMRRLVEGLLELARVDNGSVKTAYTGLDLSALVEDALLPFEPLYFEKGMELEAHLAPGLQVCGSESHLRQVVEILLDNAMKYAWPESRVQVYLLRQGKDCLLSVANPGPPLSPEDQKNIFKRFYRVDKARTMSGSYGLGLPIAEGIVKAHSGQIWAESGNGLNVFHVLLPLQ